MNLETKGLIIKHFFCHLKEGLRDIFHSLSNYYLFLALSLQDLKSRYSRSRLGPWWITINMFILISVLSFIFGNIFESDIKSYIPHLAFGFLTWNYISNSIIDGSASLNSSSETILQVPLPLSIHILKTQITNIFIFCHHLILVPILIFIFPDLFTWKILLIFPGFIILTLNLFAISIFLSVLCARFKDFAEIIKNLMQICFYLTPIIWMPNILIGRVGSDFLYFNPFNHFINLIREPLLGSELSLLSWTFSVLFALFFIIFSLFIFGKNKKNISYWI